MEKVPDWAKFLCGFAAVIFVPTVGFVYSQGESNEAKKQLVQSNKELNNTIQSLSSEINTLSLKLGAEMVKIDYSEKRLGKIEEAVVQNSKQIAVLSSKGNIDG